ncbi:AfsR/SARP family transcriptional regulator [Micromonospora foliorum]|uniref:AfsR/SARP family transcriptional regulator n=1 Tax=Micromonospora foliorum TaxID=2911210 RepID=UPI001EE8CDF1|nr:hypothetical protein [Micromonospora foliorum]MCG5439818.1 hypothetical protein [Micromonospora foliorum]
MLLVSYRRTVATTDVTDALWSGNPPTTAVDQVRNVSRLRRTLFRAHLDRSTGGHTLEIAAEYVDVARFERLLTVAREESKRRSMTRCG